eukprot:g16776.t1
MDLLRIWHWDRDLASLIARHHLSPRLVAMMTELWTCSSRTLRTEQEARSTSLSPAHRPEPLTPAALEATPSSPVGEASLMSDRSSIARFKAAVAQNQRLLSDQAPFRGGPPEPSLLATEPLSAAPAPAPAPAARRTPSPRRAAPLRPLHAPRSRSTEPAPTAELHQIGKTELVEKILQWCASSGTWTLEDFEAQLRERQLRPRRKSDECGRCGTKHLKDGNFCRRCGLRRQTVPSCPKCGARVKAPDPGR